MTYDPEKDGVWVPLYIIEMTSSINAAILLAQLSWMLQEDRSKMRRGPVVQLDGGEWVARTDSDWSDIRLDRSAAHRARQGLERDGLIEVRASKANGRKVTLLRPCYEPLQKARIRAIEKRESAQIKARIRADKSADSRNSEGSSPLLGLELDLELEQNKSGDSVQRIFDAWLRSTGRTGRTVLDAQRRRAITKALDDYPEEDVLDAVRGWEHLAWYRGEAPDNSTPQNDLTMLLRDSGKIEKFRDAARGPRQVARNGKKPPTGIGRPIIEDRDTPSGRLTPGEDY